MIEPLLMKQCLLRKIYHTFAHFSIWDTDAHDRFDEPQAIFSSNHMFSSFLTTWCRHGDPRLRRQEDRGGAWRAGGDNEALAAEAALSQRRGVAQHRRPRRAEAGVVCHSHLWACHLCLSSVQRPGVRRLTCVAATRHFTLHAWYFSTYTNGTTETNLVVL